MRLPVLFQRQPPPDLEALTQRAASAAVAEYRAEQERAAESARVMLQEAQEIARQQSAMPSVYGGNGRGSLYDAFARDHPYHWSQPGWTTWRPGSLLTVDTLRQFSQRYDVLRAMVNYLKDHVKTVPMQVVARDDNDDSERAKRRIKAATAYFSHDGGLGGPGEERWEFEGKLIEDLVTLGVGTVYLPTTRGGGLLDAVTLDSATIRPRVDMLGWPGPGDAWYEQVVDGIPHRTFTQEQLYWKGLYPRNDSPYPDSPIEYLALTVLAAMSADTWNREWLTNGTEPGRMVPLPGDWTPAQAQGFIDYFLGMLSGNIQKRQQVFFVPAGTGTFQNPTRRDHDFQSFMEWLARRCSAIMGVQLAAIGFPQGQYAATQEKSIEQTADVGMTKILVYLTSFYCYLLGRLGYPDLCAKFVTADEEGAAERTDRVTKLVGAGIWTPNRALKELGDEADPSEGANVLWVPATMQPMDRAMNPPEPVAPGNGAPPNGSRPAQETEEEGPKPGGAPFQERVLLLRAEGGHFVTIGGHPIFINDKGGADGAKGGGAATAEAMPNASTRHGMSPATAEQRKALAIPPAWTDVHVADDPNARLQAIGKDAKGRAQYRYSAAHAEAQSAAKFERGRAFHEMLPKLRERIAKDTEAGNEEAAALHLIAETGFRVGGSGDTKAEKEAFGASTLRAEHVRVEGDTVHFDFTGKKGVRIQKSVTNRGLADTISGRIKEGERLFNTSDSKVRDYLHSIDGEFKVKDFRTWHGTAAALDAIRQMEPPGTPAAFNKARAEVGRHVAQHLGNTATVALASYIDPHVFEPWRHRAGVVGSD